MLRTSLITIIAVATFFVGSSVFADVSGSLAINDILAAFNIDQFKAKFSIHHLDGTPHAIYIEPTAAISGADGFTSVRPDKRYTIYANISIAVIAHECVHSSYYHYYTTTDMGSAAGNETLAYDVQQCVAETLAELMKAPTTSPATKKQSKGVLM